MPSQANKRASAEGGEPSGRRRCVFKAWLRCPMGGKETAPRPPAWSGGPWDAPLAHRRPGYPLVGLLASRASLRFTRRAEHNRGDQIGQGQIEAESKSLLLCWHVGPLSQPEDPASVSRKSLLDRCSTPVTGDVPHGNISP